MVPTMSKTITVDGCDYTIRTADAEDGWDVRNVYGDIVADFSISDVCEGVEYAYYLSDGDIVDGINTEMFYDEWSPERIAAWLVSTHPES